MHYGVTIEIEATRLHGLEVYRVLVGGEVHAQFLSLAGARTKVMQLKSKLAR